MSLDADLTTTVEDEAARFELTVKNNGNDAVDLDYRDSEKVDFVVEPIDGDDPTEHWRYSEHRAAAQVVGTDRLEPGDSITYDGEWDPADPGEYVVRGTLRAERRGLDAEDTFAVDG